MVDAGDGKITLVRGCRLKRWVHWRELCRRQNPDKVSPLLVSPKRSFSCILGMFLYCE